MCPAGGAGERVLELYAGPGELRRACWWGAKEVLGFDLDLGAVAEVVGDTERLLRHMDVTRFSVVDADAFAAPWLPVWLVAQQHRRAGWPASRLVVFGTDGSMGGQARMNPTFARRGWSRQMCEAAGVDPLDRPCGIATSKTAVAATARRAMAAMFSGMRLDRFATSSGGGSGGTLYFAAAFSRGESP